MSGTPEEPVKEPVNEPVGDAATDAKVNTTADAATEVAEVVDPVKAAAELENAKRLFQERAKSYLVDQQQHVVVPSYSAWFDISKIHSIEKKLFPDFFPLKNFL